MIEVRLIRVTIRQTGIADGERIRRRRVGTLPGEPMPGSPETIRRTVVRERTGAVMDLFEHPSNGVMMFVMTPFFIQQNGGTGFRHVRESLCRIWLTGLWPETKGELP